MTISTYYNGINWVAAATFPSTFHDIVNEFYNTGVSFDSPEKATLDLLNNLSELTQIRLINRPEEELNYHPLIWYSTPFRLWYCEIHSIDWRGLIQSTSRIGISPEEALRRTFETLLFRSVHIPQDQAREAQDLFTV